MDARLGRPVVVTPPAADARQVYAQVAVTLPGGATTALQDDTFAGLTTAQIGTGVPGLRTEVAAAFAGPGTLYSLAWTADRFVTGFSRAVDVSALATVRAEFGASQPGSTGLITRFSAGGGYTSSVALPARRTEYFTPGSWRSLFTETAPAGATRIMAAGTVEPVDAWNQGLYGPAFPPPTPWRNKVGTGGANPAWSADAAHGGPPPGPVTVRGDQISAGGTTWTVPPGRRGGAAALRGPVRAAVGHRAGLLRAAPGAPAPPPRRSRCTSRTTTGRPGRPRSTRGSASAAWPSCGRAPARCRCASRRATRPVPRWCRP